MKWRLGLALSGLLAATTLSAVQMKPWLGAVYEPQIRVAASYFQSPSLNGGNQNFNFKERASLQEVGGALTITPNLALEVALSTAYTDYRYFFFNCGEAAARYLWLDDVQGDPVSLVTGLALAFPSHDALHDPAIFHHSYCDTELYLSCGKELSRGAYWTWRFWALAGLGVGVRGYPWCHEVVAIEKGFCDRHEFSLKGEALQGLGHRDIEGIPPFAGYALLAHRSIDLSFAYTYRPSYGPRYTLELFGRAFAENGPARIRGGALRIVFPLSI